MSLQPQNMAFPLALYRHVNISKRTSDWTTYPSSTNPVPARTALTFGKWWKILASTQPTLMKRLQQQNLSPITLRRRRHTTYTITSSQGLDFERRWKNSFDNTRKVQLCKKDSKKMATFQECTHSLDGGIFCFRITAWRSAGEPFFLIRNEG